MKPSPGQHAIRPTGRSQHRGRRPKSGRARPIQLCHRPVSTFVVPRTAVAAHSRLSPQDAKEFAAGTFCSPPQPSWLAAPVRRRPRPPASQRPPALPPPLRLRPRRRQRHPHCRSRPPSCAPPRADAGTLRGQSQQGPAHRRQGGRPGAGLDGWPGRRRRRRRRRPTALMIDGAGRTQAPCSPTELAGADVVSKFSCSTLTSFAGCSRPLRHRYLRRRYLAHRGPGRRRCRREALGRSCRSPV